MKAKQTRLGDKRLGRTIQYNQAFGADIDDGIPFAETVDWIRQFNGAVGECGYFLLVGAESYPMEIWHGYTNSVNKQFTCIYVADEDNDNAN